jgi:hypothetical protein
VRQPARTWESAATYAVAFFLTTLLHELAHALVGASYGRAPVLFTTFVRCEHDVSTTAQVATALAGPVFSLVQGLALGALVLRVGLPARWRLFLLWMGYHGLVNFVGYVFSTAFAPGGDLNRAATMLGVPFVGQLVMTGLGYAGLRWLVRPLAPVFLALRPDAALPARPWSQDIGLFAGLLATPALILALLPPVHWLAFVYVVTAPLPLLDLMGAAEKAPSAQETPLPEPKPWAWTAAFVVLVVVARLVLDRGVRVG